MENGVKWLQKFVKIIWVMGICCFVFSIRAEAAYSPNEAVNYARNHCASGHTSGGQNCPNSWQCAEFVSKCLQEGGMGNATQTGCRSLYTELNKYGTSYALTVDSNGYININRNQGKISVGDVIITRCNVHGLYLHAVLVSSIDGSGYVYNYAHNANKMNQKLTASRYCTKKKGNETYSNITAYVIHFPQNTTPSDTTPPEISDIQITDHDCNGYTISCVVTDNSGSIARVQFPTWTEYNGQDDIAADWGDNPNVRGTWNGNRVYFRVNVSDHNYEEGVYTTHIYAYDHSGNHRSVGTSVTIDRTEPVISNVRIGDVSVSGYTVYCDVTDNMGIARVQFPTWTDRNGQDDLADNWGENLSVRGSWIGGNTYAFRVDRSEHNDEVEGYTTDIYAWDNSGNRTNTGVRVPCLLGDKIDFGSEFVASIQNIHSTTVLTNDHENVSGRAYKGNLNQKWLFKREENGNYRIYSLADLGKCLSVEAALEQNGINVGAYSANGTSVQSWKIYGTVGQGYSLVPEFSAVQALALESASTRDGANVQLYKSNADEPQRFSINYLATFISLSDTELNMKSGMSRTISAWIEPTVAAEGNVIWSTSDSSVAIVEDGVITAKSPGTAIITATTADSIQGDSPIAAQCRITVSGSGKYENEDKSPSDDGKDNDLNYSDMDWIKDENQDCDNDRDSDWIEGMLVELNNHQFMITSSFLSNLTVEYSGCADDVKSIVIPDAVTIGENTYKVTSIAKFAFSDCEKLKYVTIGKNVKVIGTCAFANCPHLEKVTINSKRLKTIGTNAFKNDRKLKTMIIKSSKLTSKSIGKNAIKGTNARLTIKAPKNKVKVYQKYFRKKGNVRVKVKRL